MGVGEVYFTDITDYVVLITYLMRQMGLTKTECKQFLSRYEAVLERFRAELPINIYSKIIRTNARGKLTSAREFLRRT